MYKFDTVLFQFLETWTSEITLMGHDQELKWLAFSLYPLSFFLYRMNDDKAIHSKSQEIQLINPYMLERDF